MRRDVFQAIADPTRRKIMTVIAHQPVSIDTVVDNFNVSRQAISKHIKILTECGLIVIRQQGRERLCIARPDELNEVTDWVKQFKQLWTARLDNMDKLLGEMKAARHNKGKLPKPLKKLNKRSTYTKKQKKNGRKK
jgi:DNA-binding transcriptional ArsR family regulator